MKEAAGLRGRYDFSLDYRQVVLIISGVLLVLMLSFFIGALVGRNVSAVQKNAEAEVPASTPARGEEDVLGGAAPFVQEPDSPPIPPGAMDNVTAVEAGRESLSSHPSSESPVETPPATAPVSSPLSREAYLRELENLKLETEVLKRDNSSSPAAENKETKWITLTPRNNAASPGAESAASPAENSPKAAESGGGSFTIQIASFPERREAEALLQELKSKGYEAYLLEVTIAGKGTYYRVRVGHYTSMEQAKKALAIMQKREGKYLDAWITE